MNLFCCYKLQKEPIIDTKLIQVVQRSDTIVLEVVPVEKDEKPPLQRRSSMQHFQLPDPSLLILDQQIQTVKSLTLHPSPQQLQQEDQEDQEEDYEYIEKPVETN